MICSGRDPLVIGSVSCALRIWPRLFVAVAVVLLVVVVQGGLGALGRSVLQKSGTSCGGERGSIIGRDQSYLPLAPAGPAAPRAEL